MRYAVYGLTIESAFPLDTLPSPEGDGPVLARQLWTMFGEPGKAAALASTPKTR